MKNPFPTYARKFSENKLWKKLSRFARKIGIKAVYSALLLFYAYRRSDTPKWAKNIIIGVLGYLLSPIDAIPDLSPILGYTDDLGVLSFGLVTIAAYVNIEVRENARKRLQDWFGEYDASEIQDIDDKL